MNFTWEELLVKRVALGVLVLGGASGVAGGALAGWMGFVLGYTEVFRRWGMYVPQDNFTITINQTINNSDNQTGNNSDEEDNEDNGS